MTATTIRRAKPDDAAALASLAKRTFQDTFGTEDNLADMALYCTESFSAEVQRQEILDENYVTLLAEVEGQLVAFAQVRLQSPKDCVSAAYASKTCPSELYRLYVAKVWHGQGVAQAVMAEVVAVAAQAGVDCLWLGVWEHNPRAIAFYRKCGFTVVGEHIFQFGSDSQRDLVMLRAMDKGLNPSNETVFN
ncbi:MAG: N-acetyltransferase family protein [Phormidesmis sp.]